MSESIRQSLRSGQRVYASCVLSPSPMWPKMLKQTGIDFAFIDSEHTPQNRETLAWMCQSLAAMQIAPVVRITRPCPFEACAILDGGAAGIIAPYVESVDQVQQLHGAARLRPLKGIRLQDTLHSRTPLEPELEAYLAERNKNTILIANIESVPAIENLDAILSLGALDAVLIGPHDLSCSLGIPEQYEHPRFIEAVGTIFRKARAQNCGAGIHWWRGVHQECEWIAAGANLIMHSTDMTLVAQHLADELAELRAKLGDTPRSSTAAEIV